MIDATCNSFVVGANWQHDKIRRALINALAGNGRMLDSDQILNILEGLANEIPEAT